ncbi:transposase, partial [bacterium]|nr:transposase [bacterium]
LNYFQKSKQNFFWETAATIYITYPYPLVNIPQRTTSDRITRKLFKEKLYFESILSPGRMINKTAYIYELLQKGKSETEIRELAQCGLQKVRAVERDIAANKSPSSFYTEPKRGRPTKMTNEMKAHLLINAAGPISDASLAQDICSKFGLRSLARSTINLYRKMFHFQYKPPKQRQLLTEEQKKKRKRFVYSIFNLPDFPWRTIIFSDESRVCLGNDSKWVWRRRGDTCQTIFVEKTKYAPGIMIYGAIGHDYKSKLVFTSINIKSDVYTENLEKSGMFEDLQDREYVFMQDGAPSHTSKMTKQWLHSRCDFLAFWPSNSPDLNPIEMIWGIMKKKISLLPERPNNIENLQTVIQEIWDSIDMNTINRLIESFYYRLLLVAMHEGESIQPYYRHEQEKTDEEYIQKAEELLQNKDEDIQLLKLDELIMKKATEEQLPVHMPILEEENQFQPVDIQQPPIYFQQQPPIYFQQQPPVYFQQQPVNFQQQPVYFQQQPVYFQQQPVYFQSQPTNSQFTMVTWPNQSENQ